MDQRLRDALRTVSTAAASFVETTGDRARLLDTVVRSVAQVVPDTCVMALLSEDGSVLTVAAIHDDDPSVTDKIRPLVGAMRQASTIALDTLAAGTVFMPHIDFAAMRTQAPHDSIANLERLGARGMMIVPLRARDELLGLMAVVRHRAELPAFDALDREIAELLAGHAALALANARLARERQRMASEVEASRFLDAVIENIPDMVFVKDAEELRFVRFNRAGEELLGIPSSELIGKNDYDFFPKQEADFFTRKDRETLAARALVDIPEEPIQTKHGERWLHTKKVPIVDASGTPRYLLGISEDITGRKDALVALAAAKERAEAANRELEAFSYSVAHDLRAPLRAIDGFAQALLDDYAARLDDIGRRHLQRIRAAAQRMATLIDDLLRLSRVTRAEHHPVPVDLSRLARAAVAQLERIEPGRKIDIVIEDNITATGDPKLLAIVFDNLFGNAWKFTSKTEHPHIELGTTRTEQGERVYFVRDNGAGFDMAYQNKLFGVFQRLHPAHEFPGTGIGLATVKRIIERHGGRIWAEGALGKGATFFFTLGGRESE